MVDTGRTDAVEGGGGVKGRSVARLRSTACSRDGGGGGSMPPVDSVAAGMISVEATGGCPVATETVSAATRAGEERPPLSEARWTQHPWWWNHEETGGCVGPQLGGPEAGCR